MGWGFPWRESAPLEELGEGVGPHTWGRVSRGWVTLCGCGLLKWAWSLVAPPSGCTATPPPSARLSLPHWTIPE